MKKLLAMFLVFVICLSLCACGNNEKPNKNNDDTSVNTETKTEPTKTNTQQMDYPKMEEIEYYFINGVSYNEPVAFMGYTNNSNYTIVSMLFDFTIKADATQEELSAFDSLVTEGKLDADKIAELKPKINNYMVCDPGEKVEGVNCYLKGNLKATDEKQCQLFVLKSVDISFQGDDGAIYTVTHLTANNAYSLKDGKKPAKSWTDNDFAKDIPMPDSRFIIVDYDKDDYFQFTAYDITFEQYQAYCQACQEAGFSNDIEDGGNSFWCTNANGLKLNIRYFTYMNALSVETH